MSKPSWGKRKIYNWRRKVSRVVMLDEEGEDGGGRFRMEEKPVPREEEGGDDPG